MTDLKAQKRMAVDILNVGKNRVWFGPEEQAEIAKVITREDIHGLVDEDAICAKDAEGNSKSRAREHAAKRSYGHHKGAGSREDRSGARQNEKDM